MKGTDFNVRCSPLSFMHERGRQKYQGLKSLLGESSRLLERLGDLEGDLCFLPLGFPSLEIGSLGSCRAIPTGGFTLLPGRVPAPGPISCRGSPPIPLPCGPPRGSGHGVAASISPKTLRRCTGAFRKTYGVHTAIGHAHGG